MSTLQQNLQRPFYIKHLLERLRYGKAAVAMRREAAELIEKMNEDSSNLSAQNSYQAMRIEELERDLAAAQKALRIAAGLISTIPPWDTKHPQDAYDFIVNEANKP